MTEESLVRAQRLAERRRNPERLVARDECDAHVGGDQRLAVPHHFLLQDDRRAADLAGLRHHLDHVIDARGAEEVELHRAHDEMKAGRFLRGLLEQLALIDAQEPDEIRAPALHEAQIARVIDEPGEPRLDDIATDGIGALEGYSVNEGRFSDLLAWRAAGTSGCAVPFRLK